MSKSRKPSNAITFMLELRANLQMYHWTTDSYARHKATDELLDSMSSATDDYVERFMGRYGKSSMKSDTFHVRRMTDADFVAYLKSSISFIESMSIEDIASDLKSIRDDMLGYINKCIYLSSLT